MSTAEQWLLIGAAGLVALGVWWWAAVIHDWGRALAMIFVGSLFALMLVGFATDSATTIGGLLGICVLMGGMWFAWFVDW